MLRSVAVLLQDPVALFEFGVLAEVFGIDRTDEGVPAFDFRVCALDPATPFGTSTGTTLLAPYDLSAAADADLVAVPASAGAANPAPEIVEVLRAADRRGAFVLSVCSGAYTLGAAGLLDGRSCATHWRYAEDLARQYPLARVDADVLYARDGNIITSAGTAAGIDAALALVRDELGGAVANAIARRMVVPPHRDGGQRQYVERPVPVTTAESLGPVLDWAIENLAAQHTVETLAKRARLSGRTFARRFAAETGTTPHTWLTEQRLLRAKELLQASERSIEQVATDVGFGSAALLRHHFLQCTGVTPTAFRRTNRYPV